MSRPLTASGRPRLPSWFRRELPAGGAIKRAGTTASSVHENRLHTVCEEAKCPNIHTCWSQGTATFMVAGRHCTRNCRFCSVPHALAPPAVDADEPGRLADAVERMQLDYAVITVVNRDDLPDGGAAHYRGCLDAVHARLPTTGLELLCSDLAGNETALGKLLEGAPLCVFAHNVETVERLSSNVRDAKASFARSLRMLSVARGLRPDVLTKSSLMVGLGETEAEMIAAMEALRAAGVDLLTIGQYLAPSASHYPVLSFPAPARFDAWQAAARAMGFLAVAAGPLVRSSYRAGELYREARGGAGKKASVAI